MVGRVLVPSDRQELPQRERIRQPPRDAPLAVEAFEETDHHDAEVQAWRQRWPSQLVVVEAPAVGLAKGIKTGTVQNLVQPLVERVTWCGWQFAAIPQSFLSLSLLPRAHRHKLNHKVKTFYRQHVFGL